MPSLEQAKFLEAVKVLRRNPHTKDKTLDTAVKNFLTEYQDNCMNVYAENPYILVTDFNLPFYYFRYRVGINDFTRSRIKVPTFRMHLNEVFAAISDILNQNESQGNSYLYMHDLYVRIRKFFNYTSVERLSAYLHYFRDVFYYKDERVAFLKTYQAEKYIYDRVSALLDREGCTTSDFVYEDSDELAVEQNDAIRLSMTADISIITGGPGTGKTTTIKTLLEEYKSNYPNRSVRLLAPTGKASRRLTESVDGYGEARTVDSLTFGHKIRKEEQEDIDLCIIDEFSMESIFAFCDFLRYINPRKMILVGDIDQLSAIGAGNLLYDFIHMGVVTATLDINHRNGDTILENARKIKNKKTDLKFTDNFQFVDATRDEVENTLVSLRHNDNDMILTPYRYEAEYVNEAVHNNLFPCDYVKYSIGDRVMLTKNRKAKKYVNGDTGVILRFEEQSIIVGLDNSEQSEIVIKEKDIDDMTHAYAITVHKSQGSEYPTVIIARPTGCSNIFSTKLLYTAVTRAKNKVILVGDRQELDKLITTSNENDRVTFLADYAI